MGPELRYYQIGGFRAHSHAWAKFKWDQEGIEGLARAVAGKDSPLRSNGQVELVLGILPSGASYLLMSSDQMEIFAMAFGLRNLLDCWESSAFVSLSPIHFSTTEELLKKLKTYNQKSKKGKSKDVYDDSQANRGYVRHVASGSDSDKSLPGIPRGSFEHQRLLYRILRNEVDCFKFGLPHAPWSNSVRFVSLVLNTWQGDERKKIEQLQDPKVLDISWTEISGSDLLQQQHFGPTVHIRLKENYMLRNPGFQRQDFKHGSTEVLNRGTLAARLKELFETLQESKSVPVILLIHDQEVTKSILDCAGVDLSCCQIGISKLLHHNAVEDDIRTIRRDGRSRSRSPHREFASGTPPNKYNSYSNATQQESANRRSRSKFYAPIYVVDVKMIYQALMQSDALGKTVASTASELGHSESNTGWCAGNESHMLIEIWRSLASGPPIDEQRVLKRSENKTTPSQEVGISQATEGDSDDDRDPHKVVFMQGPPDDPYADLEDDYEEDW